MINFTIFSSFLEESSTFISSSLDKKKVNESRLCRADWRAKQSRRIPVGAHRTLPLTTSSYPRCLSLAEFSAAVSKVETKRKNERPLNPHVTVDGTTSTENNPERGSRLLLQLIQ